MASWYVTPVNEYDEGGRHPSHDSGLATWRRRRARERGATWILTARYALDIKDLPAGARQWLKEASAEATRIGSTTYQSSTWAVVERSEWGVQSRGIG